MFLPHVVLYDSGVKNASGRPEVRDAKDAIEAYKNIINAINAAEAAANEAKDAADTALNVSHTLNILYVIPPNLFLVFCHFNFQLWFFFLHIECKISEFVWKSKRAEGE